MALSVDADGHLLDLSAWNEAVAVELATRAGIELTDAHWQVIQLVRAFYRTTGVAPAMRPLVKLLQAELGQAQGSSLHLLALFPGSPARLAARLAGLPRPTNCL